MKQILNMFFPYFFIYSVDPKTTTKMNSKSESDTTPETTTITKSSPSITG